MTEEVVGRGLRQPALVSDQAPSGLDPSGFDPARRERLAIVIWLRHEAADARRAQEAASVEREKLYRMGQKDAYLLAAMAIQGEVHAAARDSDQSGEAGQTAQQAGPEGRERGPKASPNG